MVMPAEFSRDGQLHAFMAVDPGGTTGVAAAYVRLESMLKATLLNVERRKAVELEGGWEEQAKLLASMMERFVYTANVERALPLDHVHVVCEDFILRRRQEGGATGNLTSIWVAAGAVARADLPVPVEWQQPSSAKTLATNDRLRLWGLWEVGSEHKRDAWRHFALAVNRTLG